MASGTKQVVGGEKPPHLKKDGSNGKSSPNFGLIFVFKDTRNNYLVMAFTACAHFFQKSADFEFLRSGVLLRDGWKNFGRLVLKVAVSDLNG